MADARLAAAFLAVRVPLAIGLTACSGAPTSPALPPPSAPTFATETGPLPVYRSHRLSLSLPLPDGRAWRIDDHSQPALVATHAATRSRVAVDVFAAQQLVGRAECEELARTRGLVPPALLPSASATGVGAPPATPIGPPPATPAVAPPATPTTRIVEDVVAITEGAFDTRIEVVVDPGNGPDRALAGRVMAFGGFLRKCYVFVYSTEVPSAADEPVLSSRLALFRARVLGGLELEPFDAVSRPSPAGPKLAPDP